MDVSIIVPVYNASQYLKECLDSLINQKTKYDYEIIAVNDGSSDNSLEILNSYKKHIRIIDKENTGPGDSRNIAISKSIGKYLMFVDSDDYVTDNFIEVMVSEIIKNKASIVVCDFYRLEDGNITHIHKGKRNTYIKGNFEDVLRMEFHSCNKVFKRELLINNPYPKGMFFEDVVAISGAVIDAKKIVKIEDALYYYRRVTSSTTNIIDKTNHDLLDAIEMTEKKFLDNGYKDVIEYLYVNGILVDLCIKLIKANKDVKEVKKIVNLVESKYPNCYKNKYLKEERFFKRLYLYFLRKKRYSLIYKVFKGK